MTKRKNRNKKTSRLLLVGSFLIFLGLIIIGFKIYNNYLDNKNENQAINDFLEIKEEVTEDFTENETSKEKEKDNTNVNYIAVIEIPKINLKKGLFSIDDKNNNVNKNIEILKKSDMPNVTNGLFALAGHSGNSKIAYFNKLHKLEVKDQIYIYYENNKYVYEVTSKDIQDKDGTIEITKHKDTTELVLTTCDKQNKNKQVVIIAKLVDKCHTERRKYA